MLLALAARLAFVPTFELLRVRRSPSGCDAAVRGSVAKHVLSALVPLSPIERESDDDWLAGFDTVTGLVLLAVGVVAWRRSSRSRVGLPRAVVGARSWSVCSLVGDWR